MPLTDFQRNLLAVIGPSRSPKSYLAGGTALHFAPESTRYSHDLDIFHDSLRDVAQAYEVDGALLSGAGFALEILISQPGFIRAMVTKGDAETQIDWAHDSAWRFMPVIRDELGGYVLHEIDLATNKILALAGRDEPRDFVDTLYVIDTILPLGPLVWAAVDKDPGFSPFSLLEQIRRRGRYRHEDFARLDLTRPLDLTATKECWQGALDEAETFVASRPAEEAGCLYYASGKRRFVGPAPDRSLQEQGIVCHFGRPGGVLPQPADQSIR